MAFYGNRDVTITAIDVSGGIVCSRTSDGDTNGLPFFVHVSASAITATGTSVPYEDLDFRWDFGDAAGTELFTRPTDGARVNANNNQRGAEAAYVYRTAGTFTITLRVYGKNGSSIVKASTTLQVTAVAYDTSGGIKYWDPGAAVNGNGDSSSTPYNSVTSVNTFLSSGSNKKLLINRGSHYTGSTGLFVAANPLRIEPYGTGADPIIDITSGNVSPIFSNNAAARSNIVISQIKCMHSGSANGTSIGLVHLPCASSSTNIFKNIYLDRCTMQNTIDNALAMAVSFERLETGMAPLNYGVWGGSISGPLDSTANKQGIFGGPKSWFFVFGTPIDGAGNDAVLSHHIYPQVQQHSLYKWIEFGPGVRRNYCVDTNYNSDSGSMQIAQYILISENYMAGTQRCWDAGQSLSLVSNPQLTDWRNYVAEGNCIVGMPGDLLTGLDACSSHTARDNLFWNCTQRGIGPANQASNTGSGDNAGWMATNFSGRFYRNYFYWPYQAPNASMYAIIDYTKTGGFAYLKPQLIVDNVIIGMRATEATINVTFADFVSNGSLIDRNVHWAPGDVNGTVTADGVTAKTWAQWRASGFDANGANSDPGVPDAANGRFTDGKRTMALSS